MTRKERDQEAVNRIVSEAWTVFRHDEAIRCTTVPELVAALRKLKSKIVLQLRAAKHQDWVGNTEAFIEIKIEEIVKRAEQAIASGKPVDVLWHKEKAPKKKKTIWLPKFARRKIVPPEAN